MELKPGYKQTEVGVIPEDWDVLTLAEIGNVIRGASPRPKGDKRFYGGNIPRLMVEDVTRDGKYVFPRIDYLTVEGAKRSRFCKQDTLTIVCSGTVGITAFLGIDACIHDGFLALININKGVFDDYLYHQLCSLQVIFNRSATHGGVFTNLTTAGVKQFNFPLPSTKTEQTAIANALSDADALIQSLTRLIAKKRQIKQGVMQTLLNPYENGQLKAGWVVKSILEFADNKKELFDDGDWIESEHITNNGIRLIQTGNIGVGQYVEKEAKKYIYETSFEKLRCKPLIEGDLLICRLAEPAGRACVLPDIGETKIVTSVDVTIFRPRKDVANRIYLANLFSTPNWFKKVSESVGGTTHKRISRGSLGKIEIAIPNIDEQTGIATLLSDMDAEIAVLEAKLDKYRHIKQGMMQNLLTGRIRLVKPESNTGAVA